NSSLPQAGSRGFWSLSSSWGFLLIQAMTYLYKDPMWSSNMSAVLAGLSGGGPDLKQVLDWLEERSLDEHFSLSDIWGSLISAIFMKQLDRRTLAEEAERCTSANPYPVYSTLEKNCHLNGQTKGRWFELTPHEAGFTELNRFIPTSQLDNSRSPAGGEKKQRKGMDMVSLQGIVGSAMADEERVLEFLLPDWLKGAKGIQDTSSEDSRNTPMGVLRLLQAQLQQLTAPLQVSWVVFKLFPLIGQWKWGTIENFLYQSNDAAVPSCLRSEEKLQLVDAGLYINSPYPPFLGPKRADLILAREYAAEMQKPFPLVDDRVLKHKDWPQDFYVFPGELSTPTVVYMPLFNRRNCRDAAEVKAKLAEYTTYQGPYSKEKIAALLKIAMANMKNNRQNLLNQIRKAVILKYSRR
ncbi:hypothetical protein NHX12_031278, partial [Muraenolepis orangiensis]